MGGGAASELRENLDAESGVLTLMLNRPSARNALTLPMLTALGRALDRADRSDEVRAIVLTGAGQSFCAGGDIKLFARGESIFGPMDEPETRVARHIAAQRETTVRLVRSSKPTVALLNGHAVGAGLALALACDLRFAAIDAVLRTGFVDAGLAGDFGCTWLLNRIVGRARAIELLYLSTSLSAETARDWGLVNDVFATQVFLERSHDIARQLARCSAPALQAVKDNLRRTEFADVAEAADAEVQWHVRLMDTPEHQAAVRALQDHVSRAPSPESTEKSTS